MFTYAEVERLLAGLHGADVAVQRGALRGRLKHLKRLGIPLGIAPGKGKKIEYGYEQLFQWAFCLALEECGLDPTLIANLVRVFWDAHIHDGFKEAQNKEKGPLYFYGKTQFMAANWIPPLGKFTALPLTGWARENQLAHEINAGKTPFASAVVIDVALIVRRLAKGVGELELARKNVK